MAYTYDEGLTALNDLAAWYAQRIADRNEATTRHHLVDNILKCLGWDAEDVRLEEAHDSQYADYVLSTTRPVLVVEAKREGDYFALPAGFQRLEYSAANLCREYPHVRAALRQVTRYCQDRGVPLAAVCNGHQLIAMVGARTDGVPPLEGRALIFDSMRTMQENFLQLWQALSKPGVEAGHIRTRLLGSAPTNIPPKLTASIPDYPGIKIRNAFQADLQVVSELVLEDVLRSPELETRFLEECYCQSGALSQYAMVSRSILQSRYSALFDAAGAAVALAPASEREGISPALLAESMSRRPVLIVGDVGVGKTAFIRNLMKVEAADIFDNAIAIYIDLGTRATLAQNVKDVVVQQIETQLLEAHSVDILEHSFIRGVYHGHIERFGRGLFGELRKSRPDEYELREIKFLEELTTRRDEHIRASLEHIAKGRKQQVVIFIDNADQRDDDTQQQAFLIGQEIAAHWPATVFITLRPETFHRSVRVGALSGYHPKAFAIYPPRVDLVIEKRLAFARQITRGEIPLSAFAPGVQIRLQNLETLIATFMDSLKRHRDLFEAIDNIASGNVRLALDLVRGFFGSGHVNTAKIVDIVADSGSYTVPVHEFLRAVVYGDSQHYDPTVSPLANLLDVGYSDPSEHFLLPITLTLLSATTGAGAVEGFVESRYLYEQLQGLGFVPEQIDSALARSQRHRLIEASGRRVLRPGEGMPSAIRVTPVGVYHVSRLLRLFTYVDAVVVDTPIFDAEVRAKIRDVMDIQSRLERAEALRNYLDAQWSEQLARQEAFDWAATSAALKVDIEQVRQRADRNLLRDRG